MIILGNNIEYLSFWSFNQFYMFISIKVVGLLNIVSSIMVIFILIIYAVTFYFLFYFFVGKKNKIIL